MEKMWSGRFSASASSLLDEFNASIMYDRELYIEDIEGSLAHASMLAKQGILTTEELKDIVGGLNTVKQEIEDGKFEWSDNLIDKFSNVIINSDNKSVKFDLDEGSLSISAN